MNVWKTFLAVIIIIKFLVPLYAGAETMQPADPLAEQLMKLKKRLALDDTQTAKLREILEKQQAAASKDRETFKNNALNLIQAAYVRQKEKEAQVGEFLNSFQKEQFKEIVKMTRFDRDLFELTEGLVLNDEQAFTVEGILIDYYNKVKVIMPEGMWTDEGPGPGVPMGTPKKGLGAPPQIGLIMRMMKSLERKKNNAVKKVLTSEQKKRFEQIQKDRSDNGKEKHEIRNSKLETIPNDQKENVQNKKTP